MSELAEEQVERLAQALHPITSPGVWRWDEMGEQYRVRIRSLAARTLVPTVAAMLDERERLTRAEVVRKVEVVLGDPAIVDGRWFVDPASVRAVL